MRICFLVLMFVIIACKEKSVNHGNNFTTKTGKTIVVNESHPKGKSLSDIEIQVNEFANGNHFILKDVDPITKIELADLDENGFDELYIFTKSAGSGSYGKVIGYGSNRDKSLSPIYFLEIHENDLKVGGQFEGYLGHDTFTLKKDKLIREFPVYKKGDSNANPTGGTKTVSYLLVKGEASWQLKLKKTYKEKVIVIRDCSGTYIRFNGNDFKVCNDAVLESFENKSEVQLFFTDVNLCEVEENVATCMLYHGFMGSVHIENITSK